MHALRAFIEEQMDARGWTATDLVNASGLSKQTISVRLKDSRDRLAGPLEEATVDGLARAFGIDRKVILVKVGEAMGLPMGDTVTVYSAEGVSNEELIRVLQERLGKAGEPGGNTATTKGGPQGPTPDDLAHRRGLPTSQSSEASAGSLRAARHGQPANPPDTITGEESQDPGTDEPA